MSVNIKILSVDGVEQVYNNVDNLTFQKAEGGTVVFHPADAQHDDATLTSGTQVLGGYIGYGKDDLRIVGTIPKKMATTYRPGRFELTISNGYYLDGVLTIEGDLNLVPENIVKNKTIFGVAGTATGGLDPSDATATASDILFPKTAYIADGTKATGTIQTKTSSDITVAGPTVTVPQGYYNATIAKSVPAGSVTIPSTTQQQSTPSISVDSDGLITASVAAKAFDVIPTVDLGYIIEGTAGTITMSANSNTQLLTTKDTATYIASTSDQGIEPGLYLIGPQTFAAVELNAEPSNMILGTMATITSASTTVAEVLGNIPIKTFEDLEAIGSTVFVPAGYYEVDASKDIDAGAEGIPTATKGIVSNNSIDITTSVTNTQGYIEGKTLTGESVTVNASELVDGTVSITLVGEVDVTNYRYALVSDDNLVASNIKTGSAILGTMGSFTDESTLSPGLVPATAAEILAGSAAWVNGAEIAGSMTNQGKKDYTITSQGESQIIPAGYHDGTGKVTANIAASVLDNSIISGLAVEEAKGDYAWKSTVTVPAGFHNALTIEKTFSEVFPAPETPATATLMLLGYQAYNKSGVLMTGTMANNGAVSATISTQGNQYTIPAGYHNGSGKVTASINNGVITSGAGTATVSDPSYNSTSGVFTLTVSGTVAAPTVGTAGYVSSSAGTKNTNTVSGSKTLAKIVGSTSITGTKTYAPTLARTAKPSSDTWTDAASSGATTTKPTSGPYVQIDAAANTGTITATPSVTTAGYGTSTEHGILFGTATVGAAKATTAYVPIKTGSATTPATTKAQSTPSISIDSAGKITASVAATSVSVTPNVSAGWVSAGTAGTVTMSASSNEKQLTTKAATTITPSTSSQTAVASGVYTTGVITVAAMPSGTLGTVSATKGTVSSNSISVTPKISAGTAGYNAMAAKSGTAVTVSASELVSGNKAITASTSTQSNIDVTNYATVSVAPTPTETKTATANGTITPSSGKYLSSVTVAIPVYAGSIS